MLFLLIQREIILIWRNLKLLSFVNHMRKTKWAPSSVFVSSSIPSWQILTAHAQPFRGARVLAFCLNVPLDSLLVWASSEGSGETARMRRLAWTFTARIGDKYQIRLTRSKCFVGDFINHQWFFSFCAKTMVYRKLCFWWNRKYRTVNNIVESPTWIISHEFCWDKSWKANEIFYFNQIDTWIEIFDDK